MQIFFSNLLAIYYQLLTNIYCSVSNSGIYHSIWWHQHCIGHGRNLLQTDMGKNMTKYKWWTQAGRCIFVPHWKAWLCYLSIKPRQGRSWKTPLPPLGSGRTFPLFHLFHGSKDRKENRACDSKMFRLWSLSAPTTLAALLPLPHRLSGSKWHRPVPLWPSHCPR